MSRSARDSPHLCLETRWEPYFAGAKPGRKAPAWDSLPLVSLRIRIHHRSRPSVQQLFVTEQIHVSDIIFNNYSTSARWIWDGRIGNDARSVELAIIISYPTSTSGIIISLKMSTKYREFVPTLFVKTTDFQLVFKFEQTRRVTILYWRTWYNNGSYTMMAKLIRALKLHSPMIQFLIKEDIPRGAIWRIVHSNLTCGASFSGAQI